MAHKVIEKSKPVNPKSTDNDEEQYCVVRWRDDDTFGMIHRKQIKTIDPIELSVIYTIDFNGTQRKGTLILKGTKRECEKMHRSLEPSKSKHRKEDKDRPASNSNSEKPHSGSSKASDTPANAKEESNSKSSDLTDEVAIQTAVLMKLLQLVVAGNSPNSKEDNNEVHKVPCASCGRSPISSDRYKCLICDNINLCAKCFEQRRESNTHKSGHAFAHFKSPGELFGRSVTDDEVTLTKLKQFYSNEEHKSIKCDGCQSPTIKGLRFKCDTCPRYDLCLQCFKNRVTTETHTTNHPLIIASRHIIPRIPVDDIELGKELGRGAFGSVHKAKWISKNRLVACKVITIPNSQEAERLEHSFLKELSAYVELSGAYILKTYGFAAVSQSQTKKYMILMEYMSRGSLSDVIKREGSNMSLRRKLNIAMNIASGMRKIHEHRMIHRDIRPDNILLNDDYVAKIGDMGIARVVDPLNQHTQIGCAPYMPPEFYSGSYNQKLDIFTYGLTLNELFTSKRHSFQMLARNKIAFVEESPIFPDLIGRCTVDDPKRRPTALEIEKTFDLYMTGFQELAVKQHPNYNRLSNDERNRIFLDFYKRFHPSAVEFIRKKFPSEFLDNRADLPGVKVDQNADNQILIECPVQ